MCFRGTTQLPAWTSRPHPSFPSFLFWFLVSREDVSVLKCHSRESSPGSLWLGSQLSRGVRKEGAGSVRLPLGTEFLISTCCVYRDGFCYITGTPVSLYKLIRGLQLECQGHLLKPWPSQGAWCFHWSAPLNFRAGQLFLKYCKADSGLRSPLLLCPQAGNHWPGHDRWESWQRGTGRTPKIKRFGAPHVVPGIMPHGIVLTQRALGPLS